MLRSSLPHGAMRREYRMAEAEMVYKAAAIRGRLTVPPDSPLAMVPPPSAQYLAIWKAVAELPAGRVASYGDIAALANLPGRARLVGKALREAPDDKDLPWHRVLRSNGELAFPVDSAPWQEQRTRLLAEGVLFKGTRVDLKRFRLQRHPLDKLLWGEF